MDTSKRKRGRPRKDSALAIENKFMHSPPDLSGMDLATVRSAVRTAKVAVKMRSRGKPEDAMLGERIKYLRTHVLNLPTQQEFADAIGLSRGAIGNWEQGKGVKRDSIDMICRKFNVSMQWLRTGQGQVMFSGQDDPTPPVAARMKLLPPADYEFFNEQIESQLTVLLDHVKRRDSKGDGGRN